MNKQTLTRALGLLTAVACVASFTAPTIVSAKTKAKVKRTSTSYLYNPKKHYKDEHVTISNPTSKCVNKTTTGMLDKATAQLEKDGADHHVTTSTMTLLGDAYRKYEMGLGFAWGAMEAPYCGYGAFGVSAAQHSLSKSLGRLRHDFLASVGSLEKSGDSDKPSVVPIVNVEAMAEAASSSTVSATVVSNSTATTESVSTSTVPVVPAGPLIFKMADGKYFSPQLDLEDGSRDALIQILASSTHE